ncbi:MAG: adenylate kinase [Phycisphaerae bacterium]|nr:adenylate kinase [Phycisphaerae bacterium]
MNVILLGPPGAGKGTQAKRVAQAFGLKHLSSGDILRAERKAGTELGKKAQEFMDAGKLVPDDLVVSMMVAQIDGPDAGDGVLLDGFPRTRLQAEALDAKLAGVGKKIDRVVDLVVADDKVAGRLMGRRSCSKCGAVYHVEFNPPKAEGQCDNGCGELTIRPDDTEEVVRQRLETYHEQTAPLTAYYRDKALLREVDGAKTVDEVAVSVESACR